MNYKIIATTVKTISSHPLFHWWLVHFSSAEVCARCMQGIAIRICFQPRFTLHQCQPSTNMHSTAGCWKEKWKQKVLGRPGHGTALGSDTSSGCPTGSLGSARFVSAAWVMTGPEHSQDILHCNSISPWGAMHCTSIFASLLQTRKSVKKRLQ